MGQLSFILIENVAHVSVFTQLTEVIANEVVCSDDLGDQ